MFAIGILIPILIILALIIIYQNPTKTVNTIMKKAFLLFIFIFLLNQVYSQNMIGKSKRQVMDIMKNNKAYQFAGNGVNDLDFYVVQYNRTFHPPKLYPFQATYYYWFDSKSDSEQNVCVRYNVAVPTVYIRYMMYNLKGYVQVNQTNFKSTDGKTRLELIQTNDQIVMAFLKANPF